MPDNLESRLDQLGSALAGDAPVLAEGAPFAVRVRDRARGRIWRRVLVVSGGVGAVAAAIVLVALLSTPGPSRVDDPGRPMARGAELSPYTMAQLSRHALAEDDPARAALPADEPNPSMGDDEPITVGAVHSQRAVAALLAGR